MGGGLSTPEKMPIAVSVDAFAEPFTVSGGCAIWKAITASAVPRSNVPFTRPRYSPIHMSAHCKHTTLVPDEPTLSSASARQVPISGTSA